MDNSRTRFTMQSAGGNFYNAGNATPLAPYLTPLGLYLNKRWRDAEYDLPLGFIIRCLELTDFFHQSKLEWALLLVLVIALGYSFLLTPLSTSCELHLTHFGVFVRWHMTAQEGSCSTLRMEIPMVYKPALQAYVSFSLLPALCFLLPSLLPSLLLSFSCPPPPSRLFLLLMILLVSHRTRIKSMRSYLAQERTPCRWWSIQPFPSRCSPSPIPNCARRRPVPRSRTTTAGTSILILLVPLPLPLLLASALVEDALLVRFSVVLHQPLAAPSEEEQEDSLVRINNAVTATNRMRTKIIVCFRII